MGRRKRPPHGAPPGGYKHEPPGEVEPRRAACRRAPRRSASHHAHSYGGASSFIAYSPETWGFDLAADTWAKLDDGGNTPGNRFWGELVDAGSGKLILFGGHDDGAIGLRNDTWSLGISSDATTATWTNLVVGDTDLTPAGADRLSPERRDKHSLVATGDGKAWLFGGVTDCGPTDDVWLLDLTTASWSNPWKPQIGETCARRATPTQSCASDCGNPL